MHLDKYVVNVKARVRLLGNQLYKAYSKNLGQRSILARGCTFYERRAFFLKNKGTENPPYSVPIQSLFCIKLKLCIIYNFRKRGQHSIVERNIGLEYALHCRSSQGEMIKLNSNKNGKTECKNQVFINAFN